jgi:hypothetical protein
VKVIDDKYVSLTEMVGDAHKFYDKGAYSEKSIQKYCTKTYLDEMEMKDLHKFAFLESLKRNRKDEDEGSNHSEEY